MENIDRKKFIQLSLLGVAGITLMPWKTLGKVGANDTIRIGVIGLGRQSVFLTQGFQKIKGIKIVAGADVYGIKRQRFEQNVKKMQEAQQQTVEVKTYENYQDILSRDDINAVVIATPDHWHAMITLDACRAKKDIYLEKPLTFTIEEGIKLCEAVRNNNLILGVGSQQRSDLNFQHAVKMVREGKLGNLKKINAYVGAPPSPYIMPEEEIPTDLNWDKWLGPNPYIHYNSNLNPPISLNPTVDETFWAQWRYHIGIGGGSLCDWGAHNFDIAQWALDKDNGGPVKVIPAGYEGQDYISFVYDNGIIVANEPYNDSKGFGLKFQSDDAWIEVSRGHYSASDNSLMPLKEGGGAKGAAYETGTPHLENFIESLRSRKDTIAPVEAGHRSGTMGIIGNIATNLNRPLNWDPINQKFVDDNEANTFLKRQYREGYKL